MGLGMRLAVGVANAMDAGRAEALGLPNPLVGRSSFESPDRDLPNLKSLPKNPRFSTFCSMDD